MNEPLIVRGRWVLADAATLVADGAVLVAGDSIAEVGPWAELRGRHPEAKVIGSDETGPSAQRAIRSMPFWRPPAIT